MNIAFLQLSDFHTRDNSYYDKEKVNKIIDGLYGLEHIDCCYVFLTGDIAFSGKKDEYKAFERFLKYLLIEIRRVIPEGFIPIFSVPGNHDINFPPGARGASEILGYYGDNTIDEALKNEHLLLRDYYNAFQKEFYIKNYTIPSNKIAHYYIQKEGDVTLQINLINTAPFSTLRPDDKELHYYQYKDLATLKRKEKVDYCITLMHHSTEWFHYSIKNELDEAIVNNSDFVFVGHDHVDLNKSISINNGNYSWISSAGEMKVGAIDETDSFNVITLETEDNTFCSYQFYWDKANALYVKKNLATKQTVPRHYSTLKPQYRFISDIEKDPYNNDEDFNQYFVCPQLGASFKDNQNGDIESIEDLKAYILKNKKVIISGAANSGKTTLLKKLFLSYSGDKVPVFKAIDSLTKINPKTFIRYWFEEVYGQDVPFDKFQQLEKEKKILLVDGWDLIKKGKHEKQIMEDVLNCFEYVVFTTSSHDKSFFEDVVESINSEIQFFELHIKPFYVRKRQALISRFCEYKCISEKNCIEINNSIDRIFNNNYELFLINPAFILKYVNYYADSFNYDYVQGESIFSTIYHYELYKSIIDVTDKQEVVDIVLIALEEVAGYLYAQKKDSLSSDEFNSVINRYEEGYGVDISPQIVLEVGKAAKIIKQTGNLDIYFANKNHIIYFISKYLIRTCNGSPTESEGIKYALKNICFGINADIILFISYSLQSTKLLDFAVSEANSLITKWDELSLDQKNIALLSLSPSSTLKIAPPSSKEEQDYSSQKESFEESQYSEETIEARGIFEYDEQDIDLLQYELIRAIRYTDIICKMLLALNNTLKIDKKREYISYIYTYPRRIVYGMLRPIDTHIQEMCQDIVQYAREAGIKDKKGEAYTEEEIRIKVQNLSRAYMLGMFDHFSELCSAPKTVKNLASRIPEDSSEIIEKMLILDKSGCTEELLRETELLLKRKIDPGVKIMAKLVVRKHLLDNKHMNKRLKQKVIDKVFGPTERKNFVERPRAKE